MWYDSIFRKEVKKVKELSSGVVAVLIMEYKFYDWMVSGKLKPEGFWLLDFIFVNEGIMFDGLNVLISVN